MEEEVFLINNANSAVKPSEIINKITVSSPNVCDTQRPQIIKDRTNKLTKLSIFISIGCLLSFMLVAITFIFGFDYDDSPGPSDIKITQ